MRNFKIECIVDTVFIIGYDEHDLVWRLFDIVWPNDEDVYNFEIGELTDYDRYTTAAAIRHGVVVEVDLGDETSRINRGELFDIEDCK